MSRICSLSLTGLVMLGVLTGGLVTSASALAAPTEAPVTEKATEIMGTTATLNAELNPGAGATTSYDFEYSPYGVCEVFPTAPQGPVTGEKLKVSTHVSQLEGSTEYTFCAVALNEADEPAFFGSPLTFKTLAAAPEIPSESATNISPRDASLEAVVNPENRVTTYHFEYATSKAALETSKGTSLGEAATAAAGEPQPAGPVDLGGGLTPATPYFYRVVASNATGTTDGKIEKFTTSALQAPVVEPESVTGVTQTGAELHATVNPEFQPLSLCEFQFSGALAPAQCAPGAAELGEGGAGVGTGTTLAGLQANTTYQYKVLAENASGPGEGAEESFTTLPLGPAVSTGAASAISTEGATISGEVNPENAGQPGQDETTYYFQYGPTDSYGSQAPEAPGVAGEGTSAVGESTTLSGLEPGVTYHYRIVARNDNANAYGGLPQAAYGADETFTTTATLPILSEGTVSGVTQNGATFTATLDPNGLATRYELQLGATPGNLQPASCPPAVAEAPPCVVTGTVTTATALSIPLISLSPGTTYYYRLVATNADGNGPSEPRGSFTTAPAPAGPAQASLPAAIPFQSIAELNAKEAKEDRALPNPKITKSLTTAEKRAKALKACKQDKKQSKRLTCEREVKKRYGSKKKKKK